MYPLILKDIHFGLVILSYFWSHNQQFNKDQVTL